MTILFWVYKSRLNLKGEAPLMMRISRNAKRVTFSTALFIGPDTWDQDKQRIKGSSPLTKELNNVLLNLTTAAWNVYNDHLRRNMPIDPHVIRNSIMSKGTAATSLLEAFEFQIDNLKARLGHDTAINIIKKYQTTERKIQAFLGQIKRSDIYLQELTFKFIIDFDLYMRTTEKLKHNAVMKNLQQFKRVIRICMNNNWIEKDPFVNYSTKMKETDRGYLTASELQAIEHLSLPSKRLDQTRDVFVFCCYTGLAYADVSKLSKMHLEMQVNGMDWIKINRTKTKSQSVIPILPQAKKAR